jgi:Uma2 family endonuclease
MQRNGRYTYLADALKGLGGISPRRIRFNPPPGTATERDLLRVVERENRPCELVDGVLVEKPMGMLESLLAMDLGRLLGNFVTENDLGIVSGEAGMHKLLKGLVRAPDLSFISWTQLPTREYPRTPIPDLYPDLAVEILSESNTAGEMQRKLKEYFLSGTRLVWLVDPTARTVEVFTAPDESTLLNESQTLTGGAVLPGFVLPLKQLFARVPKNGSHRPAGKRSRSQKRKRSN